MILAGAEISCPNSKCRETIGVLKRDFHHWEIAWPPLPPIDFMEGQKKKEKDWPECAYCKAWWMRDGQIHTSKGWR